MIKQGISAIVCMLLALAPAVSPAADAKDHKVLVVMSYEVDYPWDVEVKEGIDSVLSETADIEYFYMNTKTDLAGSAAMGKQALALYESLRPDGVIAMDDNAQEDFVVPYLKDKATIPVIFGGVNAEPEAYGYPTDHISGILDRFHIAESIALAQQIVPGIKSVAFILKDSPTARFIQDQVEGEKADYSAAITGFHMVKTLDEALSTVASLKQNTDLLFVAVLSGIKDPSGNALNEKKAVSAVAGAFGGPTITNLADNVAAGTLCAVVKTGQEQGSVAAEMLLKAFGGTPVNQMPITRNRHGRRVINATVLKDLGIRPAATALRGADIVKTAP